MPAANNEHLKQAAINYLQQNKKQDPVICSVFGCGKQLSEWEQLYGDKCIQCSRQKKLDIMKVIKVPE